VILVDDKGLFDDDNEYTGADAPLPNCDANGDDDALSANGDGDKPLPVLPLELTEILDGTFNNNGGSNGNGGDAMDVNDGDVPPLPAALPLPPLVDCDRGRR
jgi:hypothetical protein